MPTKRVAETFFMRIKLILFTHLILLSSVVCAQTQGSGSTTGTAEQTPGSAIKAPVKQAEAGTIELPKTESEVALEHFNIAQNKQNQKEYKEALENYDRAIELDSVFYEAVVARAGIRFLLLDFETALADYNRAIEITEKKSKQFQKTGDVKKVLDDLKGSRQDYAKAEYIKTRMGDIYYKRGSVKRFMDDKAGGCEDLQKAKEMGAFKANPELKDFCDQ
jgi:tetratricopeptide (TPR) repeat protein